MSRTVDDRQNILIGFSSQLGTRGDSNDSDPKWHYDFLDITTSRYRIIYDGKQTYLKSFVNGEFNGWATLSHALGCQTDLINPIRDLTSEENLSYDDVDSICDSFLARNGSKL